MTGSAFKNVWFNFSTTRIFIVFVEQTIEAIISNKCLCERWAKVCAVTHTDTSVQSPQDSWVPKLTGPASTLRLCHVYSLRWNWKSQKLTEVETEAGDTVRPHFLFTCPRSLWAPKMDWKLSWRNTILLVNFILFFFKKKQNILLNALSNVPNIPVYSH